MNIVKAEPVDNLVSLFRLDGRVAFLSGATGLLGRPMAHALAWAGAHVILNARSAVELDALATELCDQGFAASTACFDVADSGAVEEFVAEVTTRHKRLDILVNNAYSGRPGTIESATTEDFEQAYRVSVIAPFQIVRMALPLLKTSARLVPGGASVINIGSMYGTVSPDPAIYGTSGANSPPYYGAAKAALIQMTRYAACHLATDRIRVNSICPGPFPAHEYLENDPGFCAKLEEKIPMHRTGLPHELQGPLLFLASDASSYLTGANLPVDGGWTAW